MFKFIIDGVWKINKNYEIIQYEGFDNNYLEIQ